MLCFPGGTSGKETTCQCRIHKETQVPSLGQEDPQRRAWQPIQYSCLENPMDRGAWWATVHRVTKSWTRLKRLSMHLCIPMLKVCYLYIIRLSAHQIFPTHRKATVKKLQNWECNVSSQQNSVTKIKNGTVLFRYQNQRQYKAIECGRLENEPSRCPPLNPCCCCC